MKYLRGPVVALLAFVIGVVVSPIHFSKEGMGYGRMRDGGGGFSITSYRSSYFLQLNFAHAGHVSEEQANTQFDELVAEAVEVISITPKVDEHGTIVGRRAVAMFLDGETDRHFASVFWTQGKLVHSINSTSLMHVLEFEEQNAN
jgi:hypothetical protein